MTTRVLLADDQELVRAGFRIILNSEPGIAVVGEAADGADAVRLAADLRPDVICMDVQMPGTDGLEATRTIVAADPRAAVLMLTTFDRDDYLFAALDAGASGFLLKTASPEDLIAAVQVVARGDALLSPRVTRRVIERASADRGHAPAPAARIDELTDRENEVLLLVAEGLSNAEIAARLVVGEATVKTHVSNVLRGLGLRDRIHAVIYAYENGLTTGTAER
ncbi:response regulator transcription factor [Galbitalea sp. SE-J8]|uniref:response regulator n=1 Tax=Galbitalea sp. SE-J8 TaxID=3054952 RepID=UPI00259C687E|nr:response regulator transcription factor [Galbitalea sp. SE-J8]MDM4762273.1 response regulator transcription factor [Galbitalea sp. SE-J8]